MSELLAALPKKEDLAAALPQEFDTGGIETLDSEVSGLTAGIDGGIPASGGDAPIDVAMPADLSPGRVTARLKEPLDTISAIDSDSLSASITSSPIDIDLPTPDFDINSPMDSIGTAIAPSGQVTTPTVEENIPGFDSEEALHQLRKLAAAGKATPMKLVNMYLKVFTTFIDKATDQETLVRLTVESLEEIYLGQILKLQYNLPYKVVQDLISLLGSDFLSKYEQLLDDLEESTTIDFNLLDRAKAEIIPAIVDIDRAHTTLLNFSNASIEDLQRAIDHVLEFTGEGEIVLQSFFDSFETKVISILKAVKPPVEAVKDMAVKIVKFLNDTSDKAEEAATKVSDTLKDKLQAIDQLISGDLTTKVEEINEKIEQFLKEVSDKADTAVGTVKGGLAHVTGGVEQFFEKVNELKDKLEETVDNLADQVDTTTEEGFKTAEQKIQQLLDKITEVLESESVKEALAKTKEGIDKFKKVMEEVSLQPVFDLVITKTGDIEVKVRAIKVEELGVPQKTALKLGAKVVKEVKVDEIIKPELIAIFKELRDPIAALVEELKKGVLQINQLIDEFAPGTIVRNLIENAGPYKTFIEILEKYKPSVLLEPLKDANAKLTDLVDELDPDILIEKLQGLFEELRKLAEALSPDQLNTMIMSAVGKVTGELRNIRDVKLDEILQTIKETISIQKLLEGTGIDDIADLEIWDQMKFYLGGDFLVKITDALTYVEREIQNKVASLTFNHHEEEVKKMNDLIELQINWTAAAMQATLAQVKSSLESGMEKITALENRRKQLIIDIGDTPEYKALLERISLANLIAMDDLIATITTQNTDVSTSLSAFAKPLKDNQSKLKKVDQAALELAAPVIFKRQLADPINQIVVAIQAELEVFKDAVEAIRQIIETLTALPAKIDENVAKILDAAAEGIKEVLDSSIELITQAANVLTSSIKSTYDTMMETLDKFSPYGLLNSFAATDLEDGGLDFFKNVLKSPGDDIAVFLSTQLNSEQQDLLGVEGPDAEKPILEALNSALFNPKLNEKAAIARTAIGQKITDLNSQEDPDINTLSKYEGYAKQLDEAGVPTKKFEKIRLNRMILEAMYPEEIKMSLQSLHPFIVRQVAKLYPKEVVDRLDETYIGIVDKVKELPERLIQRPLDEKYNELKTTFQENFDIEGIFKVLQVKLDGLDEDLELGLDRVSFAFNQLIDTLDSRLSA